MRLLLLVTVFLFGCPPYADFREYHYNRPQVPFQQAQSSPQISARYYSTTNYGNANALIQNYGQAGTAQIARQIQSQGTGHGGYVPPQHTSGASQLSYSQANNGGGVSNHANSIASSYYPQQQYTPNVNPLTQVKQNIQQHAAYVNLPQIGAYNNRNYPNSQQHGATGAYNGGGQTYPLNGKFVSQSEAGQLHSYQHQQQPSGDTQPFTRQITTCYPNGQCEQKTLSGGQLDGQRQHSNTRGRTVPKVDKCRQIAEAKRAAAASYAGGSYNGSPQNAGFQYVDSYSTPPQAVAVHSAPAQPLRPQDRRLFPYSEVVLPKDPYN